MIMRYEYEGSVLRNMNIDYELVGFYQAHPFGACFAQEMVDSLVDYQASVQDGVVLIYGWFLYGFSSKFCPVD